MNLINDFVPNRGAGKAKGIWIWAGFFFLIMSIAMLFTKASLTVHFIIEGIIFILSALMLFIRLPTLVTISGIDTTFNYKSIGCLGKEKTTTVQLSNAKISYRIAQLGKVRRGWRLRLYNNYFKNRITVDEFNFTKEQMDTMVELINKYRGTPV